ncbi:formylglycine-generating enzyme family protein [Magnetospirillum sulfuroxidans]|nr:SUMF1/EgtB/PvdO family nonheme iron enzyme [Magnetospirillum sulfuroxidans]
MMRWLFLLLALTFPARAADCPDCPEMVAIPSGLGRLGDDAAPFTVRVAAFALARTETSVGQWKACVAGGGCAAKAGLRWPEDAMPMTNVTFADAQAFAAWLSRRTGQHYRLPSEAEWEYAARASSQSMFPWGGSMEEGMAVCQHCDPRFDRRPAPVGTMAANAWGLADMNGNVWEWTSDCWFPSHQDRPRDAIARIEPGCPKRTVKGGSWYYVPYQSRSASRVGEDARAFGYDIGFRVARD